MEWKKPKSSKPNNHFTPKVRKHGRNLNTHGTCDCEKSISSYVLTFLSFFFVLSRIQHVIRNFHCIHVPRVLGCWENVDKLRIINKKIKWSLPFFFFFKNPCNIFNVRLPKHHVFSPFHRFLSNQTEDKTNKTQSGNKVLPFTP